MGKNTLALLGGNKGGIIDEAQHPLFSPEAVQRVTSLLERGATVGLNKGCSEIQEAELAIADWQGAPYCLGTASGHAALHSALIGLEITSGAEVITTPFTWGASISCILHNNAIPVFADTDPVTGLLDPVSVEERITKNTRAILVVHIFGQAADMTSICALAKKHGLAVIEDGSQAHGALHNNRKVGGFGDAAGFSCMGAKLLASSEAGYMVTQHEDVYWKAAMGGQHMGRSPESGFPEDLRTYADSLVYTYRLNPITAVLLVEQLKKVDGEIAARRKNAEKLRGKLSHVRSIAFPEYKDGDVPSYHMITMNFVPEVADIARNTYIKALVAEGVSIYAYIPAPIPFWPRMQWKDYDGPRVMWTETLKNHGTDYSDTYIPNCEYKVSHSLEMGWNFTNAEDDNIDRLAASFIKVEENLPHLRDWERSTRSQGVTE